ncbi:hypothetical protein [Alkalihalobacillus sp. TS-13]|nr:hypothetical protein [Alkalihalobacillus sp. TS-13]
MSCFFWETLKESASNPYGNTFMLTAALAIVAVIISAVLRILLAETEHI